MEIYMQTETQNGVCETISLTELCGMEKLVRYLESKTHQI